jgi:ABC-2 type transport system permease protein
MAAVTRRRAIVWTLVQRDLRVRYSSSLLGYVWTVLDPLLMASVYFVVFTFIFKAGARVADRPYFLYLLSGLLA